MSVERPTFHESWYRVAELRPRLRSTLRTYRQNFRGREWYVVQDAASNQHFRLDDAGFFLIGLLDGGRTVSEAWKIANDQLGDRAPTQGEVINLLGQLYTANLLHSDLPADAAGMLENYRKRVRREIGGYFTNILFMRIPLFDPDALLSRWEPIVGWLFGRWGFAMWGALIVAGVWALVGRWDELVDSSSGILAPENLFLLYVSFAVIKGIHEFGHGFACKRIGKLTGTGGEVHVMGIMLLVFTPIPYVDASSSWVFRSRWHRAFVGAAGMYVELAVAAIAAMVWANTSPGMVHSIAYNVIFVASVSTILFNANPLLRFDGYYILSDILEIPNLAQRSRANTYYLVKKYVYGVKRAVSVVRGRGERFWLPVYGVSSTIYRVIIFAGIILFVADKFFIIGAIFAIVSIVGWVFVPLGRFIRYLATSPELMRTRPRAVSSSVAFFAVVLILIGAIPFPDRARAEGVIEPHDVAIVYAEVDGFVREVTASGLAVTPAGTPLLVSENRDLEADREKLLAERRLTTVRLNRASIEEIALAQSLAERRDALDTQIARIEHQLGALELRAPIAGQWTSPEIERLVGAYVRRGDRIGLVADLGTLYVRTVADQSLGPRIEPEIGPGSAVEIRVRGRPEQELDGRIDQILPAGSQRLPSAALGYLGGGATEVSMEDESGTKSVEPFFEIRIALAGESADAALLSGQRVVVRFSLPSRPLAAQWWSALRRLVQRRFQI